MKYTASIIGQYGSGEIGDVEGVTASDAFEAAKKLYLSEKDSVGNKLIGPPKKILLVPATDDAVITDAGDDEDKFFDAFIENTSYFEYDTGKELDL